MTRRQEIERRLETLYREQEKANKGFTVRINVLIDELADLPMDAESIICGGCLSPVDLAKAEECHVCATPTGEE